MILEGWRGAVLSGLYAGVRYDCASESVARWISSLAKTVLLSDRSFLVAVQMGAEEIAALPAAAEDEQSVDDQKPGGDTHHLSQETAQTTTVRPRAPTKPASMQPEIREVLFSPQQETAEDVEARERRFRDIFGPPVPSSRRRWRL